MVQLYSGLTVTSHKLANTREPNSDKGELYYGEEAIQGYKNQYTNQADQKHRRGKSPKRHCSSTGRKAAGCAQAGAMQRAKQVSKEEEATPGAVARCVRVHYTGFSELR